MAKPCVLRAYTIFSQRHFQSSLNCFGCCCCCFSASVPPARTAQLPVVHTRCPVAGAGPRAAPAHVARDAPAQDARHGLPLRRTAASTCCTTGAAVIGRGATGARPLFALRRRAVRAEKVRPQLLRKGGEFGRHEFGSLAAAAARGDLLPLRVD